MTQIENIEKYRGLHRVTFFTKTADWLEAGTFDNEGGMKTGRYKSGVIFDPKTDLFDDTIYHGKPILHIFFEHPFELFGFTVRALGCHNHEKIFVSTNPDIPITDLYRQTENGDIFIFGTPKKAYGEMVEAEDNSEIKLFEVEPHVNKEEIAKMMQKIDELSLYKRKLVEAEVRAHKASLEAFLQLTRAAGSEATNIMFAKVINSLIKKVETFQEKIISVKVESNNKLQAGIDRLESELDLNVPWDTVKEDKINTWATDVNRDLNFMTALRNQNPEPSDEVREYAFSIAVQICGMQFLRQRLQLDDASLQAQSQQINTLSGLTTNFLQKHALNKENPQQTAESMNRLINMIRNSYERNGRDMGRAMTEVRGMVNNDSIDLDNIFYQNPEDGTGGEQQMIDNAIPKVVKLKPQQQLMRQQQQQ
jgi:hypothetical protein